jgi:MFS family permease
MRASLATILMSWSALLVLGAVFDQLTQQQGVTPAGHPVIGWSYAIFDVAMVLSALILGAGCLPLWLLMLRRARRDHNARVTACLLMPVAAPIGGFAALAVILGAVNHPNGVGPWSFLIFTLMGCATAGIAAAGPAMALRTQPPRGPAVRLAAIAAALATATIIAAFAASVLAAVGLSLWAHQFAGYHNGFLVGTYLAAVTGAGAVAVVSATRGFHAALAG